MLLIRELNEDTKIVIEEGKSTAEKKYHITGIFMQAEQKNRNGRIYRKPIMEKAVNDFQPLIDKRRAVGEMKHPATPQVDPERASHIIQKLYWEGNDVYGKAKIMTEMPMGKIAKGLIDEGVQLGVSSRGLGSLKMVNGINEVQDDFMIATIDIVLDPSAPDAWMTAIVEGQEWIFESGVWKMKEIDGFKQAIKRVPAKDLVKAQLALFESALKGVK